MNAIPVLLIGYNRPELLKKRFHELMKQKPSALYISIDGGAQSETNEMKDLIEEIEKISRNDSSVVLKILPFNLGLARHVTSAIENVFSSYTKLIIVEDDILLSKNFYSNMCKGFDAMSETHDTHVVSAFSPRASNPNAKNHWRKSVYFSPWGWGTSREFWNDFKLDLKNENFERILEKSETWNSLSKIQKNTWIYRFQKISENPLNTWDIQFQYLIFKTSTLCLLPKFRFVDNEGYLDSRSVHTKEAKPRWFKDGLVDSELQIGLKNPKIEFIASYIDAQTIAGDTWLAGNWKKLRRFRIFQYLVQFLT